MNQSEATQTNPSTAASSPASPHTGEQYQQNAASLTAQPTQTQTQTFASPPSADNADSSSPSASANNSDASPAVSSSPAATSATSTTATTVAPPVQPPTSTTATPPNGQTATPATQVTQPPPQAATTTATAASQSPRSPHPGYLISDQTVFLSDGKQVTINELLRDRRVLLLGFVAAYTRLCQQSLSAYAGRLSELKKKYNVDAVIALSVNDHSVLSSFSSSLSISASPSFSLIADFDARVTRWLGMEVDLTAVGFGLRCKRFAMLVDKQQVKLVRVESNVGQLDVTSVDSMVAVLKEMKRDDEGRLKEQQQQQGQGHSERKADAATGANGKSDVKGGSGNGSNTLNDLQLDEQKIPPLVQ